MRFGTNRRKGMMGAIAALCLLLVAGANQGTAQTKQPNIFVIMGDDIGMWNIGAYHRGLMAGRTPNLDKMAMEYPPMQRGASFNLDAVKAEMETRMAQAQAAAKGPSN
jgi:hypothetical protein